MCPHRLIHWLWVWGFAQERRFSIKLVASRGWPEADRFPICKLSLFIYLLLNDLRFKPRGIYFPTLKKEKKTQSFFLLIICHWHIKVKDLSNSEWKVCCTFEMDAFESLPLNTNKCLCQLLPPPTHTHAHPPFPTSAHTPSPLLSPLRPPYLSALIRVMPSHRSTVGRVRPQDR